MELQNASTFHFFKSKKMLSITRINFDDENKMIEAAARARCMCSLFIVHQL